MDPDLDTTLGIYTNGVFNDMLYQKIAFLNSRLLYLHDVTDADRANFVIRYSCALYNTVNLYSLGIRASSVVSEYNKISLGIVSSRKEALEAFIEDIGYADRPDRMLKEDFVVVNAQATMQEAAGWFGEQYNNSMFLAEEIASLIDTSSSNYSRYSNTIKSNSSKLGSTIADENIYYNTGGYGGGYQDLSLLSTYQNITPINLARTL